MRRWLQRVGLPLRVVEHGSCLLYETVKMREDRSMAAIVVDIAQLNELGVSEEILGPAKFRDGVRFTFDDRVASVSRELIARAIDGAIGGKSSYIVQTAPTRRQCKRHIRHPVPFIADEFARTAQDLLSQRLRGLSLGESWQHNAD